MNSGTNRKFNSSWSFSKMMKTSRKVYTISQNNQKDLPITITAKSRNLHTTLKWVLFVAQCFAQMPVIGITEPDARYLKFTWRSWRVVYCILNIIGSGFLCIFFIYRTIVHGSDIYKASKYVMFNSVTIYVSIE